MIGDRALGWAAAAVGTAFLRMGSAEAAAEQVSTAYGVLPREKPHVPPRYCTRFTNINKIQTVKKN